MSQMSLVRQALNNRWLEEQGVPNVNAHRAALAASHKIAKPDRIGGAQRSQSHLDQAALRARCPSLIGTALYGAVRRVVWDPGLALVSHGDPIGHFHSLLCS
jgi:hypothetical protein